MWEYKGLALLIFVSGSVSHQSLINDSDVASLHFIPMIMELHACHSFSKLHERASSHFFLLWYESAVLPTYFRTFPVESCTLLLYNVFVCFSISVSELHEHAFSYCSLLWYTGI